jgi:hypothetical protein
MSEPHNHGDGPFHGATVRISRLGLVTVQMKFVADTFADIFRIRRNWTEFEGLPRADLDASQRGAGCFDLTITFEGTTPETAPGNEEGGQEWEVISEFSEEPVESHFLFDRIMEYYSGYLDGEGRAKFPETLEVPNRNAGPSKFRQEKQIKNPMFGVESYFQTGCIVRLTTVEPSVPRDVFRFADRVLTKLPITDLAGVDWGNRNWLEMQPQPRKRGNAVELVREFKMSPPGGWPKYIVGFIDQR